MEKPFVHENIKCSKQTLVLSNIALVHLIACLVYMVLTINMGTPFYDSLIAKVICKGRNRTEAIQRTLRSLDEFVLEGITTTIGLHKKILMHKKFLDSSFDTNWLAKEKFF